MRRVINSTFVSLDGIINHMDRWHFEFIDSDTEAVALRQLDGCDALLMGRHVAADLYAPSRGWCRSISSDRCRAVWIERSTFRFGGGTTRSVLVRRDASRLPWCDRADFHGALLLRNDPKVHADFFDGLIGEREPVDGQEIDAVVRRRGEHAPRRMASASRTAMPSCDRWPRSYSKRPEAGSDVARLEEADDLGEQGERVGIVVRPRDEAEHLDLRLDGRSVSGEHVHPVVLGEQRRRAPGFPRKDETARVVELRDFTTE